MDYTSSSQVSYPVFFFSKILSFVSLFFLFCFCNCMIALLFIFDNTFSEYFICFVNFDTLHISYQSLCIVYSEYFDYYSFYFISGMIKPFLRHSIYKLNLGLVKYKPRLWALHSRLCKANEYASNANPLVWYFLNGAFGMYDLFCFPQTRFARPVLQAEFHASLLH